VVGGFAAVIRGSSLPYLESLRDELRRQSGT